MSTTISRASVGPPGPPCGSALEGPNWTRPPPSAPRCRISPDSSWATSRSLAPAASFANVAAIAASVMSRSEEHTSELQSQSNLVCRLLLEKKNNFPDHSTLNLDQRDDRHPERTELKHGI